MLTEDIKAYREPKTGGVSNLRNPPDHSCDNALLFSATYLLLEPASEEEIQWYQSLVGFCQIEPGLYGRYPGDRSFNSHDDLTGIAAASAVYKLPFAQDIYLYGVLHDFAWDTEKPGTWSWRAWLSRIVGFEPFLRSCASLPVGYFGQIMLILGILGSLVTPRGEVSGLCLTWLKIKAIRGKMRLVDLAIELWLAVMEIRYPGGLQEVYRIYFGEEHALTRYAPREWAL